MNNTVLVVDDDAGVLETYRTILTGENLLEELGKEFSGLLNGIEDEESPIKDQYDLLLVNSGEKAIHAHAEVLSQGQQVAVALVDMRMPPGMNGLETAVALRKQDPNIYIVIITAYSDYNIDEIQGALQHDFILLSKPVDPEEFRQITRNAAVSYHRFVHLKHPQDFPLGGMLSGEQGDLGRVLIVDNDPVTQQYCAALLKKQCGYEISLAHSGQQALDLVTEVEPDLILLDVMMP
jgi:CheY-like chemotaxis protein